MVNPGAEIDWTDCELIERIPGKVSGRPIVRGTRILPDGIVNSYDMGDSIEDIRDEGWPSLSVDPLKGRHRVGRLTCFLFKYALAHCVSLGNRHTGLDATTQAEQTYELK